MTSTGPEALERPGTGALSGIARRFRGPHLVIAFIFLIVTSWVFSNAEGFAPDEPVHYSKALSVGRGVWVSRPGEFPPSPHGFGPDALRWINRVTTIVDHPPHMAPDRFACSIFNDDLSAACLYEGAPPAEPVTRLTWVGTYEPFLYLPPGLAMRLADDAFTALRLGRIAIATICIALLALAAGTLWARGQRGYPLLGLVGAITPMVVFLSSELATNGPEIAGAICVMAVLLRLSRPGRPTGAVWLAAGISAAVLAMSRSLGPFFLVAHLMIYLTLVGRRQALQTLRLGGRKAAAACTALVAGVAANVAWGVAVQPHPGVRPEHLLPSILPSLREIPAILRHSVGIFGWQDIPIPLMATRAWFVMVGVTVIVGFVLGNRRQRFALAAVVGGCVVGTVAIGVFVVQQRVYGFPMYGRYFLPLWVTVPLVAGEIVRANRARLPEVLQSTLVPAACMTAAGVHLTAWWWNSRRHAVSEIGPILFPGHSQWTPDGGWPPWMAVTLLAVASLAGYGWVTRAGRGLAIEPAAQDPPTSPGSARAAVSSAAGGR